MTGMLMVAGIALTCCAGGAVCWQRHMMYRHQSQGLMWVSGLADLTALIQQHRGLSHGLKNGGQGLDGQLRDVESAIVHQWKQLEAARLARQRPAVQAVYQHCQALLREWPQWSVEHNLQQHNRAVLAIIHLLEDVAVRQCLSRYHLPRFAAVDILWRELLLTVENIGQLRALGTGIAAAGCCDSIERIRLSFLARKCAQLSSDLVASLEGLRHQSQALERMAREVEQAHRALVALQGVAQRELLESERVTLSSEQFFRQASAAMAQYGEAFHSGLDSVRQALGTAR